MPKSGCRGITMKKFMGKNFLLENETAKTLYHQFAEKMPIIDYHCHINPKEIYEDITFENITKVWLGGDHYKWRLMRCAGVEEKFITGDASDFEKFKKWAEIIEKAIGNPLYHWSHLELKRYFGFDGYLTSKNADEVWKLCNEKLQQKDMSVRGIIKKSNVKLICTTDDPIDNLEWHEKIASDTTFDVKVLPAWRPDKAMNLEKAEFSDYIAILSQVANSKISTFEELIFALKIRMDYFEKRGCNVCDHGIDYTIYEKYTDIEVENIFKKAIAKEELSNCEIRKFKTAFMVELGKEYGKRNWIMQLHYGCKRNNNTFMFEKLGPDTGYDAINNFAPAAELADYLNALQSEDLLPKTIIYSLNPNDNAVIGTIVGCFQGGGIKGKIQHGSAWWFNDHKIGMREQMISLANLGYLASFVGMLTDSRSFLSYTRHEYFRRILCNLLGEWVENGEYPNDMANLKEIVTDICYNNTVNYFNFKV